MHKLTESQEPKDYFKLYDIEQSADFDSDISIMEQIRGKYEDAEKEMQKLQPKQVLDTTALYGTSTSNQNYQVKPEQPDQIFQQYSTERRKIEEKYNILVDEYCNIIRNRCNVKLLFDKAVELETDYTEKVTGLSKAIKSIFNNLIELKANKLTELNNTIPELKQELEELNKKYDQKVSERYEVHQNVEKLERGKEILQNYSVREHYKGYANSMSSDAQSPDNNLTITLDDLQNDLKPTKATQNLLIIMGNIPDQQANDVVEKTIKAIFADFEAITKKKQHFQELSEGIGSLSSNWQESLTKGEDKEKTLNALKELQIYIDSEKKSFEENTERVPKVGKSTGPLSEEAIAGMISPQAKKEPDIDIYSTYNDYDSEPEVSQDNSMAAQQSSTVEQEAQRIGAELKPDITGAISDISNTNAPKAPEAQEASSRSQQNDAKTSISK